MIVVFEHVDNFWRIILFLKLFLFLTELFSISVLNFTSSLIVFISFSYLELETMYEIPLCSTSSYCIQLSKPFT